MNTPGFSPEELQKIKKQTLEAIKAKFGDDPLFGMLSNIERMLGDKPSKLKMPVLNGHDEPSSKTTHIPSPNQVAEMAYAYMTGKHDLDAAEIAEGIREKAHLSPNVRSASSAIAAILRRRPAQFARIAAKTARDRTKWRIK